MRTALFISAFVGTGLSVQTGAQVSFDLIGADLSRSPIRLVEIGGESVSWNDLSGDTAMLPKDDVLGLVTRGELRNVQPLGVLSALTFEPSMLRLTDGRRLTGALSAQEDLPEMLRWQHAVLGAVDVPLEQIDRLVLQRATVGIGSFEALPPSDRSDVLLLRNGDRLEGFVVDLGRDAVIEIEGREIAVPMESVHQVALANPREAWTGPMVWMNDGSVLGAGEIRFEDELFVMIDDTALPTEADGVDAEHKSITIRPDHVRAVSFDTRRLVPVSRLIDGMPAATEDGVFGVQPIELAGETSVTVNLPARARNMTLTAELPLRARAWGQCELLLATDGLVRARLPLSAATPVIEYELDLDGAQVLELILEPGEFGRVQTMIEVHDALIAVD